MLKANLTTFEAVLAVARHRNFRAAAAELGMSTTSLSNAVAGLERELGVRLFHRTTRSVSLTDAGAAFTQTLAPALGEIRYAWENARSSQGAPAGNLRINAALGAARMVLADLLGEYLQRYPAVTLDIVTEGRLVDIVTEGFDAGLRLEHLVPLDMVRVRLTGPLRMVVVGAPDYFARHGTPASPADLGVHHCIRARLPNGAPSGWTFTHAGEVIELDVPGQLIVDSATLMRDAALSGLGLAQLAEWYVADDIRQGRLSSVLDGYTESLPPLSLYYPAGRHVPASLRALVDLVRERTESENAKPPSSSPKRIRRSRAGVKV